MDRDAGCQGRIDLAEFFVQHGVEAEVAGVGTVILLGDLQAEEAFGTGGEPELTRKGLVLEVLLEIRLDVLGQERRARGAEGLMILVVDRPLHVLHLHNRFRNVF